MPHRWRERNHPQTPRGVGRSHPRPLGRIRDLDFTSVQGFETLNMVVLVDVRDHQVLMFATIKILLAMFATIKGRSVGLRPPFAVQGFEGWCSTRFPRVHLRMVTRRVDGAACSTNQKLQIHVLASHWPNAGGFSNTVIYVRRVGTNIFRYSVLRRF